MSLGAALGIVLSTLTVSGVSIIGGAFGTFYFGFGDDQFACCPVKLVGRFLRRTVGHDPEF